MSRLLEFENLHNTRDLGGMKTADGRMIKSGMLIRSGHLSEITQGDAKALENMVSVIVDLRSESERAEKTDVVIPGVTYYAFPVLNSLAAGITKDEQSNRNLFSNFVLKPKEAKEYMCNMYRSFAENESIPEAYGAFLKILMQEHNRAVLWHCTAGKDRAGIASVLVEEILGIPRDEIVADYLKTNDYIKADIEFLTAFVKGKLCMDNPVADESLQYLFGAEEEYIGTFYKAVEEKYGSMEKYISCALKVGEEEIGVLKKMYLA